MTSRRRPSSPGKPSRPPRRPPKGRDERRGADAQAERRRAGPPPGGRGAGGARSAPRRGAPVAAPPPPRSRSGGPRTLGGEQVEGRQAVRELLLAGRRRVRDVWLADDAEPGSALGELLELAGEARVRVRAVPPAALRAEARSEAPQGVLAHADPLPEADLDDLVAGAARGATAPFLVVLDGITDPQNLGAILRSALGAGATGAVLARHRAAHVTPTVAKAAAGAVEHLPIAVVGGIPASLAKVKEAGLWLVGLDAAGPTRLFDLGVADEPVALVLGAEGRGLGRLVAQRCDVLASIPLRGPVASLNVASAAALACFEVARRRT